MKNLLTILLCLLTLTATSQKVVKQVASVQKELYILEDEVKKLTEKLEAYEKIICEQQRVIKLLEKRDTVIQVRKPRRVRADKKRVYPWPV